MKFYNFTATQILREIKSWQIQMVKNAISSILEVLNFDFSKFEQIFKYQNCQNSKFRVF